jgi:glutaredoxin 3
MQRVEIYSTPWCPYCIAAKRLLERKGVPFEDTDVSGDLGLRQEMMRRAHGRYTVPQIFIGGTHVGGSDELHALDRAGKLDPILAA